MKRKSSSYALDLPVDPTFSLVLGGGACKGFFYSGFMRALEEMGWDDRSMGRKPLKYCASVGSMYASAISVGTSSDDMDDFILSHDHILHLFDVSPNKVLGIFGNGKKSYRIKEDEYGRYLCETGVSNTGALKKIVRNFVGGTKLKECPDLNILTADVKTGKRIVLNSETAPEMLLAKAILCSTAVPFFYQERIIEKDEFYSSPGIHPEEELYVTDGGATSNTPLDLPLKDKRTRYIIAVDLSSISEDNKKSLPRNALEHLIRVLDIRGAYDIRGGDFGNLLERDYEKVVKEGMFTTTFGDRVSGRVKGRKKLVKLFGPHIDDEFAFNPTKDKYKHLAGFGYETCLPELVKFRDFLPRKYHMGWARKEDISEPIGFLTK